MSNYKLTYFALRGKGEVARLVFAAAGVQFEDVRISSVEEFFGKIKPTLPFGQLPTLEVDGQVIAQRMAIALFLAHRFKLSGKTDVDDARCNMVLHFMNDVIAPVGIPDIMFGKDDDPNRIATLKKYEEQLPNSLNYLEKLLKENKNGDGYFVGDELSVADLALIDLAGFLDVLVEDPLKEYSKLKALRERVEKLPKIANWLATRPANNIVVNGITAKH